MASKGKWDLHQALGGLPRSSVLSVRRRAALGRREEHSVQHRMVVNMAGLRSLVGGGVTRMGEVGDHAIAGNPQVACGMKRIDGECTRRLVGCSEVGREGVTGA
jgi:hypothetical protein